MKHWFLPQTPDVLGLLNDQAIATIDGAEAFARWSAGEDSAGKRVVAAEHRADEARRDLQRMLRTAFSTPLDPADLYELSERLDAVLNAVKNTVREAEVMHLQPDDASASMGRSLATGVTHLASGLTNLVTDPAKAAEAADEAIACEREIERTYRNAMSELTVVEDLRHVIVWREMYRRYARAGELVVRVAERIWYAVVKAG